MSQFSLIGTVAIVTGASRGLGAAVARAFAVAGADVALCARTPLATEALAEEIKAMGQRAVSIGADLADPDSAEAIVRHTTDTLGSPTVLVNNAGISPIYKNAIDTTRSEWGEIFAINVTAPFLLSNAVARSMIASEKGGSIIQMASVGGMLGSPRMIAYASAKAAVIEMTRTQALEWARYGIRVNAIAPGYIATDMTAGIMNVPRYREGIQAATPLGRFGQPEEIGGIAVYLASAASSFATGQTFVVDGGISAG